MSIWLVRHGESTSNAGHATSHPSTPRLTDEGRRQAVRLSAEVVHEFRHAIVITSTYERAKMTGFILASNLGAVVHQEWEGIHEWNVLEPSKYVNTTHHERSPAVKEVIHKWDPDYVDGPEAESFHDLLDRVVAFKARCRELPESVPHIIVTHGWFMKAVLWMFTSSARGPEAMRSYWAFSQGFEIENCQRIKLTLRENPTGELV